MSHAPRGGNHESPGTRRTANLQATESTGHHRGTGPSALTHPRPPPRGRTAPPQPRAKPVCFVTLTSPPPPPSSKTPAQPTPPHFRHSERAPPPRLASAAERPRWAVPLRQRGWRSRRDVFTHSQGEAQPENSNAGPQSEHAQCGLAPQVFTLQGPGGQRPVSRSLCHPRCQ